MNTLNDEDVFSDLGFYIPETLTISGPLLASKSAEGNPPFIVIEVLLN